MTIAPWFREAGLGLFVHWDHTSQQGIEISWPLVDKSIIPGRTRAEAQVDGRRSTTRRRPPSIRRGGMRPSWLGWPGPRAFAT